MIITIRGYHGYVSTVMRKELNSFAQSVDSIAGSEESSNMWIFNGTLGEFGDKWGRKFLAYKTNPGWEIYVTQHGSFSNR